MTSAATARNVIWSRTMTLQDPDLLRSSRRSPSSASAASTRASETLRATAGSWSRRA